MSKRCGLPQNIEILCFEYYISKYEISSHALFFLASEKTWIVIYVKKQDIFSLFCTTAKLNNLRPYYYFKYILTELPKLCDEKGNIDPAKLDYLMPWSETLPEEYRKPHRP